jgi:hypothetical protein
MADAPNNNYGKHYLVMVERITRLERDVVKVDAELDKANESTKQMKACVQPERIYGRRGRK